MRLDSISWKKAQEYFSKKDIAVLPIGSTENHGSHLALGTDFLVPCEIAKAIDEKCEAILVPGIPYGVADQHVGFPGTLTIGYDGLHMIVSKIVWQLYDYGVRKFIFLNGHGGNKPVLRMSGCTQCQRRCLCNGQLVDNRRRAQSSLERRARGRGGNRRHDGNQSRLCPYGGLYAACPRGSL